MKNRIVVLLLCFIGSIHQACHSQEIFDWNEGSCLFSGKIDSSQATLQQVSNVYYSILAPTELSKPFLPYKLSDTIYLNTADIEKERAIFVADYASMEFPKSAYWQGIQKAKIKETNDLANLRIACVMALKDPKTLKKTDYYKQFKPICNALIKGGDELYTAWKELQAKQYAEAKDQEAVKNAFQSMWDSPNRALYARMEILRYVFYNQAKSEIVFVANDINFIKAFNDLMLVITKQCH